MIKVLIKKALLFNSIKLPIKITICPFSSTKLDPFVDSKYSYCFGRGTIPLLNANINYFLNKLEQEDRKDLLVSLADKKKVDNYQFVRDTRRLASGIHNKLKLGRGDTICLWSLNCYDWIKIFFACQSIGVAVCTVNPFYKEHELAFALIKCKAKALFLPGSESPQNKINQFSNVFCSDYVENELKSKGNIRSVIFIQENQVPISYKYETYQLDDLMINEKLDDKILESVDNDDPSIIMYTSGTTGQPKGVVLSNFSTINNANIASEYVLNDQEDCIVLPIPLFHSFALVCGAQVMACKNIKTILTGYRYNTESVVNAIIRENGTCLMATPTIIIDIVNYLKKKKMELPTLKRILTGAASFPSELSKKLNEVLPSLNDVRVGYGLTETSPLVTLSRSTDNEFYKTNTVGRVIEYVEVKIIDPCTGSIVELEKEGEICVRGHNVMVGYFEDEEKTKETITPNRWLKTGDRGTMDRNGFIKICGRIKEMIIKGGENIYPAEIENILQSHENILESYVFPIPDERMGEVVGCWVKLVDNNIKTSVEEIQSYCKSFVANFKVPTYVMFVDSFPLTLTGKAKKFEMTRITCEKLGIESPKK